MRGDTRRVKAELEVNQTQGASNISHGLPNRPVLTGAYLAMGIDGFFTDFPSLGVEAIKGV